MYENETVEEILKENIKNNKLYLFCFQMFFVLSLFIFFFVEKTNFSYLFFSCIFIIEFIFYFVIKSVITEQEKSIIKVPF